jgi:hypothetical protein
MWNIQEVRAKNPHSIEQVEVLIVSALARICFPVMLTSVSARFVLLLIASVLGFFRSSPLWSAEVFSELSPTA